MCMCVYVCVCVSSLYVCQMCVCVCVCVCVLNVMWVGGWLGDVFMCVKYVFFLNLLSLLGSFSLLETKLSQSFLSLSEILSVN